MVKQIPITRRSYGRAGRLVPPEAKRLRSRSVQLKPGGLREWHTTGPREELVIVLAGSLRLECRQGGTQIRRMTVRAGECVFIPSGTWHRLLNGSPRASRYLYVTG